MLESIESGDVPPGEPGIGDPSQREPADPVLPQEGLEWGPGWSAPELLGDKLDPIGGPMLPKNHHLGASLGERLRDKEFLQILARKVDQVVFAAHELEGWAESGLAIFLGGSLVVQEFSESEREGPLLPLINPLILRAIGQRWLLSEVPSSSACLFVC